MQFNVNFISKAQMSTEIYRNMPFFVFVPSILHSFAGQIFLMSKEFHDSILCKIFAFASGSCMQHCST